MTGWRIFFLLFSSFIISTINCLTLDDLAKSDGVQFWRICSKYACSPFPPNVLESDISIWNIYSRTNAPANATCERMVFTNYAVINDGIGYTKKLVLQVFNAETSQSESLEFKLEGEIIGDRRQSNTITDDKNQKWLVCNLNYHNNKSFLISFCKKDGGEQKGLAFAMFARNQTDVINAIELNPEFQMQILPLVLPCTDETAVHPRLSRNVWNHHILH